MKAAFWIIAKVDLWIAPPDTPVPRRGLILKWTGFYVMQNHLKSHRFPARSRQIMTCRHFLMPSGHLMSSSFLVDL